MRPEFGALAMIAALVLASPARAAAEAPSEDEQAVLATVGRSKAESSPLPTHPTLLQPAELDGPALQAWFNEHYGQSKPVPLPVVVDDIPDAEAEARLLQAIEHARHAEDEKR